MMRIRIPAKRSTPKHEPVRFGALRAMMRLRDGHDVHLAQRAHGDHWVVRSRQACQASASLSSRSAGVW